MKILTISLICFVVFGDVMPMTSKRPIGPTCTRTSDCTNACCRDTNGRIVGDFHSSFGPFAGAVERTGTCSPHKGKLGDVCDHWCGCDTGLTCYRPVSGVCCPPSTCYTEAEATKQKEYWAHCFADPSCALPP